MRSTAACVAIWLVVTTSAQGTPPPRWIPVPESETPGGTLCVPRLFGPAGPCFSKPGAEWEWMQTEGGWNYVCKRDETWYGFSVHAYGDNTLSREAVAAEVRRSSYNPTGPAIRNLKVETSVIPVAGSFRYTHTYARTSNRGAHSVAVGYVTPSGWIVSGMFATPTEPEDFRQFLRTYRIPDVAPK